jgi:CRISPR-associated Csx14 family protein
VDAGGHVLVAAIGKAPAVVTECWEELARNGAAANRVVILYTERVRKYFLIVKLDFLCGEYAGRVDVEGIPLPMPDVLTDEESKTFRKILLQTVLREGGRGRVHLLISGGRKTMVVDATLVALACGLPEILYVQQPAGATLTAESVAEYYDLEKYLDNMPPTELMDKIHAACHPRIRKPILAKITLPVLDETARQTIITWVMR